jgi:hypothetical protein
MKTILKEWRSFLKESDEPYPTSIAGRGNKYLDSLQKRTDITKQEALAKEAAYHIVGALGGFTGRKNFFEKHSGIVLGVLESLEKLAQEFITSNKDVNNEYFNIYATGAQREKTGSREKDTSVAYVLEPQEFQAYRTDFEAEEDLYKYATLMSDMIEDGDFDFELFKKPEERKRFFDTKERSFDQGTGGIQKPPGLSPEEDKEFETKAIPYFRAAAAVNDLLLMKPKPSEKEKFEILMKEAEEAAIFLKYLHKLWSEKTDPSIYFNGKMIHIYKTGAEMAVEEILRLHNILSNIEPTPEEKVEDLMAKARAGNKEAAKEARKILISLGRSKEAREMRMLSR